MKRARKVSAVVLAGGQGRRMDGADKGLLPLHGRPLIAWVLDRIAPQVDEMLISANRNLEQYREFGFPVLPDAMPDFPGPLAGLQAALEAARNPLVLSVPCDTPFLPTDLVSQLVAALVGTDADMAIPVTDGQPQRAVCLCHRELAGSLRRFLEKGGRRVGEWQSQAQLVMVPFPEFRAFANLNTPEELAAEEGRPDDRT
jgi:molybdopterin-guanine dinucleotide biosynthesis protein A